MTDRSMVKLIHADDFFPEHEVVDLRNAIAGLRFLPGPYGQQAENIKMVYPDIEIIFNSVLGERVQVDSDTSGVFRRPHNNAIHFEQCDSQNQWCFFVALEPTVVNFWHHVDPDTGSVTADARSGVNFDYDNLFEWTIRTNTLLEPNQGLFFRPWLFHSLESGLVQYYKLKSDFNYRILVMGLPNSSKREVALKLNTQIEHSTLVHSVDIRKQFITQDYTEAGQMRHCYRMLNHVRSLPNGVCIINLCAPLPKIRQVLNPDFLIYVTDGDLGDYPDIGDIWQAPQTYDHVCNSADDAEIAQIISKMASKRIN